MLHACPAAARIAHPANCVPQVVLIVSSLTASTPQSHESSLPPQSQLGRLGPETGDAGRQWRRSAISRMTSPSAGSGSLHERSSLETTHNVETTHNNILAVDAVSGGLPLTIREVLEKCPGRNDDFF